MTKRAILLLAAFGCVFGQHTHTETAAVGPAPLLSGFRGSAKSDIPALSQLISQLSLLAARYSEQISEIELNPVLVHPEGQGATIVDALVVRKKE